MLNKVQLIGNLGKDPETKTFPNGGITTTFSLATSDHWTDKNTGERREHTEWHSIVCNNRLAEIAQQYLRKGSKVYLEGSLRTRKWTDRDNIERYTTEIRCDSFKMLDSANRNQSEDHSHHAPQGNGYAQQPKQAQAPQGNGYNNRQPQQAQNQQAPQGHGYAQQPQQGYGNQNAYCDGDGLPF